MPYKEIFRLLFEVKKSFLCGITISNHADKFVFKFKRLFYAQVPEVYVLAYTPLTTREWTQHIQTSISSYCPPLGLSPSPCSLPYMTSQSSTTSHFDSLGLTEIFWRDTFTWFKDQGYQLRPRFAPDWIPSWLGTSKFRLQCEDGHSLLMSFLGNTPRNILISMFPVRSSQ